MPRPLRVACCQFAPLPPDHSPDASATNLNRAHAFVAEAAEKGAQLVVFPEYFISGVVADEKHHHLAQRSHSAVDHTTSSTTSHWLESFRLLAIKHSIDIVAGTIVERSEHLVDGKHVLNNVAHYINKKGEIVGRYMKRNLWHPEKEYLTKGVEDHQVFETEFGRVGMLICWDIAWPEAFRSLLLQDVEIVICPTFWTGTDGDDIGLAHNPDCEIVFLDNLIVARAFENECCVVFVNCGGKAEEGFIGRTGVTLPFKGLVKKTKSAAEELLIVDVDLDILADAKKVYGIRKDLIGGMKAAGKLPAGIKE